MPAIDLPPAAIESAVVADIGSVDAAAVAALKQDGRVRWWVELGDRLLLVGARGEVRGVVPAALRTLELDDVIGERLRLRARGCKDPDPAPGRFLAQGGRWELRQLAAGESLPARSATEDAGHQDEWHAVEPNSIVAHQYRLDAAPVAAPDPRIAEVVAAVDTARWLADVGTLSSWNRSSYGPDLALSRQWIETQFSGLGLAVSAPAFTMPGTSGQISVNNVIGRWTGTQFPDEWLIVGGHYDSRNSNINSIVNTPGAEDNASGCAGVIELARVLTAFQPQRSILFMCYAGEEQGLYGSKAHVTALTASGDLAKVQAVLTMDMIGYSADTTLDVLFESNATWSAYLNRYAAAAATYVPALRVTLSTNPFGSDHVPYLNAGKQTLLAIENDWDIYPSYHRSTDTVANIGSNVQAMGGAILKTDAAVLADLAGVAAVVPNGVLFADGLEDP